MLHPYSVNISTANLDVAQEWYGCVLGFQMVYRKEHSAMSLEIAFMKQGDFHIELIQFDNSSAGTSYPDAPRHASIRGITHFSLRVMDLLVELDRLRGLNIQAVWGPTTFEDLRMSVAFIRDPDGNLIKLVEAQ